MSYRAPTAQIAFALEHVIGIDRLAGSEAFPDFSPDIVAPVLEEAGRLAAEEIAPLNWSADRFGARLQNGIVTTAPGFKEAFAKFAAGGWGGLSSDPAYGGQGLPATLAFAVQELWQAASLSFGLNPTLNLGAIEAIAAHATDEIKALYLPKLISGEWCGTMNLTEPQAGSDVGALRTKAERHPDGTYRITGTKIYITYGEHDFTDNIIHLVLARLPDAPIGTRGISLFLVPKVLVNADGSLGSRNDVRCVGLEEKLGIHASPTCVMSFGDDGGAVGYLIGQENRGMACMFTMMNSARLAVGMQGVGLADRAYQRALAYANDRRQGKPFGLQHATAEMVPIVRHPDVRRMLLDMKSSVEAARAICLANAFAIDMAHAAPTPEERAHWKAREELLTPISKAWSTDMAVAMTSLGVQIHGGMGFIEETGAAQHFRDARITPIYEGTNGIQAMDLVSRKLPMEQGGTVETFIGEMRAFAERAAASGDDTLAGIGSRIGVAASALERASASLLETMPKRPRDGLAVASPYLDLFGIAAGAYFLGLGAEAATRLAASGDGRESFYAARILTAHHFADTFAVRAPGLAEVVTGGFHTIPDLDEDRLAI